MPLNTSPYHPPLSITSGYNFLLFIAKGKFTQFSFAIKYIFYFNFGYMECIISFMTCWLNISNTVVSYHILCNNIAKYNFTLILLQ